MNIVKVSPGIYELPKTGSMKTSARIFISEKLLGLMASERNIDSQIINACSLTGVNKVVITPDVHIGYSVPIGCVISSATHLYPAAAGYDISCSVTLVKTSLAAGDIADKSVRRSIINKIEKYVPLGVGSHRMPKQALIEKNKSRDCVLYGLPALGAPTDHFERAALDVDDKYYDAIPPKSAVLIGELGSLGGGNHFIELESDLSGQIYFMVHTGSRGFGWNIADYFFRTAKKNGTPKDQLALPADSKEGREYWNLHNMAGNFALGNHYLLAESVKSAIRELFPAAVMSNVYTISHNLIQKEQGVFIHRKGATRAFPAELCGSPWAQSGHPIIIPGSMYDGAAVLYAGSAAKESLYSVNHGSGRVMGRKQAENSLNQKDANKDMESAERTFGGVKVCGILINSRDVPLDESRYCYKKLDEVLEAISEAELAVTALRLYPIAVIKGND